MENQSFDHLLGYVEGIGDLKDNKYCNNYKQKQYCTKPGSQFVTYPDPGHSFNNTNEALFDRKDFPSGNLEAPNLNGFSKVQAEQKGNPGDVLESFDPKDLPIITTLAKEFKTCTNWYSSGPFNTDPNKLFFHLASSMGNNDGCDGWFCSGYPTTARSIYENLDDEGISSQIHWMDWNEAFSISPLNKLYHHFVYDQDFEKLYDSFEQGTLKNYTFLIPRLDWDHNIPDKDKHKFVEKAPNTQHPEDDIRAGEMLIKKVYEKLRNSQYWEKSVLLITYDEAGGFFDHKVPPNTVNPCPECKSGPEKFEFNRLGVRVPAIVISPWLKKGIDSKLYDHSSVPKTLKQFYNLKSGYLSQRDKIANSFLQQNEILEHSRQDCPKTLPEVPSFNDRPLIVNYDKKLRGSRKNQVYLMGSILVKNKLISVGEYIKIQKNVKTQKDGQQFLQECWQVLGYIPKQNKEFKYLKNFNNQNIYLKQ